MAHDAGIPDDANPTGLTIVCFARRSQPGAAHFLDGVSAELRLRGHRVRVAGAEDAVGSGSSDDLDAGEAVLGDADLVIVHDGLSPENVARIGRHRRRHGGYRLLFRHAALQGLDPRSFDLAGYDGVLAASRVIADICLASGLIGRAWIWPDAADTRRFRPLPLEPNGDVVFFGAWGDQGRAVELRQFLVEPIRLLGLQAQVHGPPIPSAVVSQLNEAGINYAGWAPQERIPEILGRHRCTVHVPSRTRNRLLPGLPSIRLFEAMACGVPLVSAPWIDCDGLFTAGRDFLVAQDGAEMRRHLRTLLGDAELRAEIGVHARRTILARHSCCHRADQLLGICRELELRPLPPADQDPVLASLRRPEATP